MCPKRKRIDWSDAACGRSRYGVETPSICRSLNAHTIASFNVNYIFWSEGEELLRTEGSQPIVEFLQWFDYSKDRKFWVHPINQDRDIIGFIDELRADLAKFYNYCRMGITTTDFLMEIIRDRIQNQNMNYRISITSEDRFLITLYEFIVLLFFI